MTSLPQDKPRCNSNSERELFVNLLRTGAARARLQASTLDTIFASLKHRHVTVAQAMAWIEQEKLQHLVPVGPPKVQP
jgi:hypothetical protein